MARRGELGKPRGDVWTEAELAVIRAHSRDDFTRLYELLPERSPSSIRNKHYHLHNSKTAPLVRHPGDYVEILSSYLVDEWECLEIWLRWNGYATCKEMSRDRHGWVTLLCTAK